jgi:hypothetical protein
MFSLRRPPPRAPDGQNSDRTAPVPVASLRGEVSTASVNIGHIYTAQVGTGQANAGEANPDRSRHRRMLMTYRHSLAGFSCLPIDQRNPSVTHDQIGHVLKA